MPKRFYAISKLILCVLAFFSYTDRALAKDCIKGETLKNQSKNLDVIRFNARVCYLDENAGYVSTEIILRGNKRQVVRNNFQGAGYEFNIDENLDLNGDGIPDLAISNGMGRGGDGFNYWWYDKLSKTYKKLGEFSHLQTDKTHNGIFFYITSSSDQYYSMRYNYAFQNGNLELRSVYGFKSCNGDVACTELVVVRGTMGQGQKKTLSAKELDDCMAGIGKCL